VAAANPIVRGLILDTLASIKYNGEPTFSLAKCVYNGTICSNRGTCASNLCICPNGFTVRSFVHFDPDRASSLISLSVDFREPNAKLRCPTPLPQANCWELCWVRIMRDLLQFNQMRISFDVSNFLTGAGVLLPLVCLTLVAMPFVVAAIVLAVLRFNKGKAEWEISPEELDIGEPLGMGG